MSGGSRNTAKGTRWAAAIRDLLNDEQVFGTEVLLAPRWGALDKGDLTGTGDFCIEAKNHKSLDLARFVDEAEVERRNAGKRFGVVFAHRRQKGVRGGYAVMRIEGFVELLKEYHQLKKEVEAYRTASSS